MYRSQEMASCETLGNCCASVSLHGYLTHQEQEETYDRLHSAFREDKDLGPLYSVLQRISFSASSFYVQKDKRQDPSSACAQPHSVTQAAAWGLTE